LSVDASGNVGVGTADPDGLEVDAAVTTTAQSRDNVRFGVLGGTPRIIFEDNGYTLWEVDNSTGILRIFTPTAEYMRISTNGVVVNENAGAYSDFRVEGTLQTHLLFVDANQNKVGIGTNNPSEALEVVGTVKATAFEGTITLPDAYQFSADMSANQNDIFQLTNYVVTFNRDIRDADNLFVGGTGSLNRVGSWTIGYTLYINALDDGKWADGAIRWLASNVTNDYPIRVRSPGTDATLSIQSSETIYVTNTSDTVEIIVKHANGDHTVDIVGSSTGYRRSMFWAKWNAP